MQCNEGSGHFKTLQFKNEVIMIEEDEIQLEKSAQESEQEPVDSKKFVIKTTESKSKAIYQFAHLLSDAF